VRFAINGRATFRKINLNTQAFLISKLGFDRTDIFTNSTSNRPQEQNTMLKCGLTKSSSERGVNKFVHHSVTFSSSIYTMAPLEHAIK
jgi:hypothetical protein